MILEGSEDQYCDILKNEFQIVLYILHAVKQRTDGHESKWIEGFYRNFWNIEKCKLNFVHSFAPV